MSKTDDGYKALLRSLSSKPKDIDLPEDELSALKKQIAERCHIPTELANRLKGTTQEEIKADAIELKKTLGINTAPPLAGNDPPHAFDYIEKVKLHNAYKDTLSQLWMIELCQ